VPFPFGTQSLDFRNTAGLAYTTSSKQLQNGRPRYRSLAQMSHLLQVLAHYSGQLTCSLRFGGYTASNQSGSHSDGQGCLVVLLDEERPLHPLVIWIFLGDPVEQSESPHTLFRPI
jgi:hypothetical protein